MTSLQIYRFIFKKYDKLFSKGYVVAAAVTFLVD